jgi:hypothetical protein
MPIVALILFTLLIVLVVLGSRNETSAWDQACKNLGYDKYIGSRINQNCINTNGINREAKPVVIECNDLVFNMKCKAYIINNYKEDK